MNVFGKSFTDYFRVQMLLIILTAGIGLARLGLSLAGLPSPFGSVASMTGLSVIAIVYLPIRAHLKAFGGYRHLWFLFVVQLAVGGLISASGIVLAAASGVPNAYEPDPSNPAWLWHAMSHFPGAPVLAPLLWLPACAVFWLIRWVAPPKTGKVL